MILEMLVVFHRSPGASPDEAILTEQAMAEITLHNLIAIGLLPINVWFAVRWLYNIPVFQLFTTILCRVEYYYEYLSSTYI